MRHSIKILSAVLVRAEQRRSLETEMADLMDAGWELLDTSVSSGELVVLLIRVEQWKS